MESYLSNKIRVISLFLMIMVVFLHSYNIDIKQGHDILLLPKDFNWLVQNFISNGITRIAVPLFFIISGFLFVSAPGLSIHDLSLKINKRLRTLAIPYFFWALAGIVIYFVLQSFPVSQPFFTKKLVKDFTLQEWVDTIFVNPIPYQLWFLRDLLVMVVLSPLLYNAVRNFKGILLLIIFPFWLLNQDTVFLTSEALLFFILGLYIGEFKVKVQFIKYGWLLNVIWLILLVGYIILKYYGYTTAQLLAYKIAIIIGIPSFWMLYDKIHPYINKKLLTLTELSFFIYAFHEPVLTVIKKGMFAFVQKTPSNYLIVYIVAPFIAIVLSIFTGILLKKLARPFYNFITGGR